MVLDQLFCKDLSLKKITTSNWYPSAVKDLFPTGKNHLGHRGKVHPAKKIL
jgi:hypothetical protein